MKHHYLLSLAFCFTLSCLSAQNPSPVWNWETNCGSSSSDKALDVALSSDGYVYSSGFFNDNGQFGNIYLNNNSYSKDAFLAKQDPNGNYLWARYCNSGLDDRALGVCVDKDDNIIITGTYWSNMTVGPYQLNGNADHVFVVKYDPQGNLLWAICGGGTGDDHGFDLVSDQYGYLFITGFLSTHYGPPTCTATFGNLPQFTYTDSIAFVGCISPSGVWQWVRTFDGADVQRDNDITLDGQGGVYVAGGFYGTSNTFGTQTVTSAGGRDIFVVKYDLNGNFQWVKTAGGPRDDRANGIAAGIDGRMYVTGEFRAELDFDGDTLNNNGGPGGKDIFVAKIDQQGNWLWASKAGSDAGGETGRAITCTNQHCIFVTGQCKGANVAFGDSISLNTGNDSVQIFVAGIDTAGIWRWAVQAGGDLEDRGYGIDADNNCRLYFCGYYSQTYAQFGPITDTTYGSKDGFVARLDVTCFNYTSDTLVNVPEPVANRCSPFVDQLLTPESSDHATVSIRNGDCMETGEWKIFNVLGEQVFATTNLQHSWNGTDANGNYLPTGTYYYQLSSGNTVASTGRILLVR